MFDLFEPVLPGLTLCPNFISEDEEQALIRRINAIDLTPFRFQQWTGKRLTHSFGWKYDFQSGVLSRGDRFPDWLLPIRDRASAWANLEPHELVQALLIRYDEGAGIGWHKDRPIYEHVLGISLGASAEMRFRQRSDQRWKRVTAPLEPRAAYHLDGEIRHDWEHSIIERTDTRYSITFRSFSDKGRAAARAGG